MRLPRGYGSVVKQSGNRRRPYAVRKTVGWEYDEKKDKSVQKVITIGYAKTKAEGLQMLSEYNQNPFDLNVSKMTFTEVYEAWSAQKYPTVSRSNVTGYTAAYKACHELFFCVFRDIRLADLQRVIDTCGKNYPSLRKIKVLYNQMYDYALSHDITNKDYSEFVNLAKHRDKNPNRRSRDRFSKDELDVIWTMKDDPYYQVILMLIYNGTRISEFLNLKKDDVHMDEQYFDVRKSKTDSGLRKVPIADKVLPFYENWLKIAPDCPTLLSSKDGKPIKYRNYIDAYFFPLMENIGMGDGKTPHWARHTCASMMADAGVEPSLQKMILGHSGAMSLTERVYTHIDIKVLVDAINKI